MNLLLLYIFTYILCVCFIWIYSFIIALFFYSCIILLYLSIHWTWIYFDSFSWDKEYYSLQQSVSSIIKSVLLTFIDKKEILSKLKQGHLRITDMTSDHYYIIFIYYIYYLIKVVHSLIYFFGGGGGVGVGVSWGLMPIPAVIWWEVGIWLKHTSAEP